MPEEQAGLSFQIEGKEYFLDDFELGELEWLEDELGANIEQAISDAPMKAAVRVVCIVKRREDPDFTLDDARKLKLTVLDAAETPTNANGNGHAAPPRKPAKAGTSKRAASGAGS